MLTTDRRVVHRIVTTPDGAVRVALIRRSNKMHGLSRIAFGFLWLFVFTIAWENVVIVPGIGTVGKLVGIVAFAVGILAIVNTGHMRRFAAIHGLMALFVVWGGFTLLWSKAPDRTRQEVLTYVQLLLMVWILRELASSSWAQRSLISAFVLGTYVSAIATFMAAIAGTSAHYQRYSAEGFNPGDLALTIVLSVPFSIYLASTEKNPFWLWIYRIQPAVAACAVLCTAARGALIDLGIACLIIPLSFRRWNIGQQITVFFVGIIGIVGIAVFVPASSWSRLGTIGSEVTSGTLNERTTIWKAGFDVFRENPINGIGVNAFAPTIQRALGTPRQLKSAPSNDVVELVAHNTFISVLVEEGVVGFLLFALILSGLWRGIFALPVVERKLWFVVFLVWTIGVMELTWEYRKPTWLLFGLLAAATTTVPIRKRTSQTKLSRRTFHTSAQLMNHTSE